MTEVMKTAISIQDDTFDRASRRAIGLGLRLSEFFVRAPYGRQSTVLAAVIASNTALSTMPGNVFLSSPVTGLPCDAAVNVTTLVTLNKTDLSGHVGPIPDSLLHDVDRGLCRVLGR